jgi:hypothetical protein
MCTLAHFTRKHDESQRQLEQNTIQNDMRSINDTFSNIYLSMPWVMRFMLYDEEHPDRNARPFKAIYIRMYVKNMTLLDSGAPVEMLEMNSYAGVS